MKCQSWMNCVLIVCAIASIFTNYRQHRTIDNLMHEVIELNHQADQQRRKAVTNERTEAIKQHFERHGVEHDAWALAREIVMLTKAGASWPDGTTEQWWEAINQAVTDGYLVRVHGTHVRRAAPPPAPKPQTQTAFDFE